MFSSKPSRTAAALGRAVLPVILLCTSLVSSSVAQTVRGFRIPRHRDLIKLHPWDLMYWWSGPTFIQDVGNSAGSNSTTVSVTITGVGAHSACFAMPVQSITAGTFTSGTVTDNHSHTYTMTASSPYGPVQTASDRFVAGVAFLFNCPSGNSTVTWTASGVTSSLFCAINVMEISYSGTSMTFDKDVVATFPNNTLTSSPMTSPSITPTNIGSLLIANWVTDLGGQTSAGSPWSNSTIAGDAYVLSSRTASTSANFGDSTTPDSAGAIIASFTIRPCTLSLMTAGPC